LTHCEKVFPIHLVGEQQYELDAGQPERLCGLEFDYQLDLEGGPERGVRSASRPRKLGAH
jgi:hypothetical protein